MLQEEQPHYQTSRSDYYHQLPEGYIPNQLTFEEVQGLLKIIAGYYHQQETEEAGKQLLEEMKKHFGEFEQRYYHTNRNFLIT